MCVEKSAAAEPSSTSNAPCSTHTAVERQPVAGATGITVSYDMGWAKRGQAMNSLTGAGAVVGLQTGMVLSYATRNKRCVTCSVAKRQNRPP